MKISLLTVHDATAPRKVDFHFWADVFAARGYTVDFVTVGFSPITFLKKGGRDYKAPFNRWITIDFNVRKFLWCPPFHPFTLGSGFLNNIVTRLFALYPKLMPETLLGGLAKTDIFIVENGAGLLLVPTLAQKFPKAKFIYTVCDRIETLGYHPIILQAEKDALPFIDMIRVPAQIMTGDYPSHPNVRYIPHGLEKRLFDEKHPNPYKSSKNAISVGDMLFDGEAVATMARNFPDWEFHLFGKKAALAEILPNVITHGEKPFAKIIPYLQHADIGIAPYHPAPNADYLSQSSLKMIQYTYCKLPIIAPDFAAAGRPHVLPYDPASKVAITEAVKKAAGFDKSTINSSAIMDWESTVDAMLDGLGTDELKRAG